MCDKTCIFCFFLIINKYLCMAKRSLLSRCPSYNIKGELLLFYIIFVGVLTMELARRHISGRLEV